MGCVLVEKKSDRNPCRSWRDIPQHPQQVKQVSDEFSDIQDKSYLLLFAHQKLSGKIY